MSIHERAQGAGETLVRSAYPWLSFFPTLLFFITFILNSASSILFNA